MVRHSCVMYACTNMSDRQLVHLQGAGVKIWGNGLLHVEQESGDAGGGWSRGARGGRRGRPCPGRLLQMRT